MNRYPRAHFAGAGASLCLLALAFSGCNGKDAQPCTIRTDDAGASALVCPGGTSTPLPNTCTIVSPDGGERKLVCSDGSEALLPSPGNGVPCVVVSNGDGTSQMTCPGGDGGLITITVRNALVNYATLSGPQKAALNLALTITSVSFPTTGNPVVSFRLSDSNGDSVAGLPPGDLSLALLKLVPATQGGNDTWVSYIAANPTSTASMETAAATATATSGMLTDNQDGSYAYTFAHNVLSAANSGTTYDATAVHRLGIVVAESGNPFSPLNVVKDFIPATGADVTGQNDKVAGTACLDCHSSFRAPAGGTGAFHGGTRYDVRLCASCHNDQRRFVAIPGTGSLPAVDLDAPGTVNPTTGAWTGKAELVNGEAVVDLPVYIHKIHMGNLLSLTGGTYGGVPTHTTTPIPRTCATARSAIAPRPPLPETSRPGRVAKRVGPATTTPAFWRPRPPPAPSTRGAR